MLSYIGDFQHQVNYLHELVSLTTVHNISQVRTQVYTGVRVFVLYLPLPPGYACLDSNYFLKAITMIDCYWMVIKSSPY